MLRRRGRAAAIVLAMSGALAAAPREASAQATAQFPIQFDFLNPGARSMGMAGAFIGAADDATAAFTNPAGLAFFGDREVSFEGRLKSVDTPFLSGGRLSGTPTGTGIDTVAGPTIATDTDTEFTPAFLALVLPVGAHGSFTAYRHDLVHIDNTFFYNGAFQLGEFFGRPQNTRDIPLSGTRQVAIANYGVSVARSWLEDRLAIGAGLALSHFHLESSFARHGLVSNSFSPVDVSLVSATAVQDGGDVGLAANVGVLWHATSQTSIGATYRRGASFEFTQRDQVPIASVDLTRVGRFKVPDVWGAGVAWQPVPSFRVLFDYDRVEHSEIVSDFVDFQALSSGREAQLHVDDANEVHAGVEYQLTVGGHKLALRGGSWYDPAHAVRYVPTAAHDVTDELLAAMLPGGKNLVHGTGGVGIALPGQVVLDFATDISSQTVYATASVLVRF